MQDCTVRTVFDVDEWQSGPLDRFRSLHPPMAALPTFSESLHLWYRDDSTHPNAAREWAASELSGL